MKEDNNAEVVIEEKKEKKSSGKSIFSIIWNTIVTIIVLVILLLTVVSVLNMQRLNEEKEPYWYMNTSTETSGSKTVTKYNMILYNITKTVDGNDVKIVLKPFFLKD